MLTLQIIQDELPAVGYICKFSKVQMIDDCELTTILTKMFLLMADNGLIQSHNEATLMCLL